MSKTINSEIRNIMKERKGQKEYLKNNGRKLFKIDESHPTTD